MSVRDESFTVTAREMFDRAVEELGDAQDVFKVVEETLRHIVTLSDSIVSLWSEYPSLLSVLGFSLVFSLDGPGSVVCRHILGRKECLQDSIESLRPVLDKEVE